jgi:hypothetical protein
MGSLCLFGNAEAAYPAIPICGSDELYTDTFSMLLVNLRTCLSTYLALACSLHNNVDKVLCSLHTAHCASSLLKYRHDQ